MPQRLPYSQKHCHAARSAHQRRKSTLTLSMMQLHNISRNEDHPSLKSCPQGDVDSEMNYMKMGQSGVIGLSLLAISLVYPAVAWYVSLKYTLRMSLFRINNFLNCQLMKLFMSFIILQNGNTKCGRRKCPTLSCDVKVQLPGQCCQTCGTSSESPSITLSRHPSLTSKSSSSSPHSRYNRKPPSKHRTKAVPSQ